MTFSSRTLRTGRLLREIAGYQSDDEPARRRHEPRGLPAEQVRNEIGAKLVAMDAIIAQCEARFGRQVKLRDHSILGPLTATRVGEASSGAWTASLETASPASRKHDEANGLNAGKRGLFF